MADLQLAGYTAIEPAGPARPKANPSNGESAEDKRRQPRLLVQGEAEIVQDGASLLHGRILNITTLGCFVQSFETLRLNPCAPVEIHLLVNGRAVTVSAEARFSTPGVGVGLRFLNGETAMQSILNTIPANLKFQKESAAASTSASSEVNLA